VVSVIGLMEHAGFVDALNRRRTQVRDNVPEQRGDAEDRAAWEALAASGDGQRMNAILRFLFTAVIIDAHNGTPGSFDYSRIEIEPNPLWSRAARGHTRHSTTGEPVQPNGQPVKGSDG
jgi:hypothetical protein